MAPFGRELEIGIQVVDQGRVVLQIAVDVGQQEPQQGIIGLQFDGGLGVFFGVLGTILPKKGLGHLRLGVPGVRGQVHRFARQRLRIGEALLRGEKGGQQKEGIWVMFLADDDGLAQRFFGVRGILRWR